MSPSSIETSVRASCAAAQKPLSSSIGTFVVAMATEISMSRCGPLCEDRHTGACYGGPFCSGGRDRVRRVHPPRFPDATISGPALKVYAGAPHGLTETHKEQLNADLLAFLKAEKLVGARFPRVASMKGRRVKTSNS